MKRNLTRARPEDIKPGFEYYVRSSDLGSRRVTYARRIVEPRMTLGDYVRMGVPKRRVRYYNEETTTQYRSRIAALKQMCREGLILVDSGR